MDQIKSFFAVFMKYHFWVLTVVVLATGLVGWYFASDGLAKQFDANKKKVEQKFKTLRGISGNKEHPNDKARQAVITKTDELRQQVRTAWDDLYEKQRAEVLQWPKGLGEEFLNIVATKNFLDDIPDTQCERYQLFILRNYFKELPKIVEAQKMDPNAGGGRGGLNLNRLMRGLATGTEEPFKVIWQDQNRIRAKYDWPSKPSAKMVWLAQEDIWVYKNLLTIIQRTNKDASGPHDAPIKVIESLEVGNEVPTDATGRIWDPIANLAGRGAMRGARDMGRARVPGGGGRRGRDAGANDLSSLILNGRYVDANGKPIPPAQLSKILEYKRLPVRMLLTMDQRELPRLLVECANATLRVEVEQVRINVGAAPAAKSGGMGGVGGGRMGGMRGIGGDRGRRPGGGDRAGRRSARPGRGDRGGGGRGRAGARNLTRTNQDPNLVQVVVQGIVYMYNRPNLAKLGIRETTPQANTGGQTSVAALDESADN